MLIFAVSYQLLLPIPDLDAQDRHVARVMFEMMLDRAYHDLRLAPHKADALAWFEGGECRAWCQLLGLDMTPLLARVEVEIDKPLRWVHKKAQA